MKYCQFQARGFGLFNGWLLFLILIVLLPTMHLAASVAMARQAENNLTILHVNDTHGHIIPYLDKSVDSELPVGGAEYLAKNGSTGKGCKSARDYPSVRWRHVPGDPGIQSLPRKASSRDNELPRI